MAEEHDKPTSPRSPSRRLFQLMQLAEESIAIKMGVEVLPPAVAHEVRSWLGRFIDFGRELERSNTLEQQRRAEEAEQKLARLVKP